MTSVRSIVMVVLLVFSIAGCQQPAEVEEPVGYDGSSDDLRYEGEVHLRNIRQLTFGGNNAEAYWSYDNTKLIFQSDFSGINPHGCDQQFVMNSNGAPLPDGGSYRMVSTGQGRTTCGFFLPDGRVIYSSTHESDPACPEPVMFADGRYVWPIYSGYDIYVSDGEGGPAEALISGPGYDAEATVSPDGRFVVFTSTRSGDLELWRYELATGETIQLTSELGYDGGAFFSPDSTRIVWRASRPVGEAAGPYQDLLKKGLVEPSELNIFVADLDGGNVKQVTQLPGANWAPFFHPAGQKILFGSNHHMLQQGGRIFDIFMIGLDGEGLEQITHSGTFDSFPMFSTDGSQLVFASNRNVERQPTRDTNIFIADWIDEPTAIDQNFRSPIPVKTREEVSDGGH